MVTGPAPNSIIAMREVSTPSTDSFHSPVRKVSLSVEEGGLVVIQVEPGHQNSPFSDLAQGILKPGDGVVEYRSRPWSALTDTEVVQARGKMGRVFDEHAWISNITMIDNILLASRYHSNDTDQMLTAEALQWCRRFGYKDIPRMRLNNVPLEQLKVCQWIRACMQSPRLLLLEHPERNVSANAVNLLAEAVDDLRRTTTGVLWVTDRGVPPSAPDLSKPKVYVKRGDELFAENAP
jgi:ABC-type ATPase involved in cell division